MAKSISSHDRLDLEDQENQLLFPRFPPEIEYEIFILAFEIQKKGRINLLCVAKRVETWLVPLIYSVLVFNWRKRATPSAIRRYGHHVQRVLVTDRLPIPEFELFEYCPNIWDLGFWVGVSLNQDVFRLRHVRRLVLNDLGFFRTPAGARGLDAGRASGLVETGWNYTPTTNATHALVLPPIETDIDKTRWFSNITHIVVSKIHTIESSTVLIEFPNLTHLMLLSDNSLEVLQHILRSNPKLEILVWLLLVIGSDDKIVVLDATSKQAPRTDDERVVTVDCNFADKWAKAATGETKEDVWVIAERTVQERKKRRARV